MALIRSCGVIAALMFCSLAFGQAKAQIDGPETSQAGNLVVLNSTASVADAMKWVIPEALEGRYIQTGNQLAFSVREEGAFVFHLVAVVVDESNPPHIDVATHTVTITDGFGVCPPDEPTDPDEPDQPGEPTDPPAPPGDFADVAELSERAAKALADPKTATALAAALGTITLADIDVMRGQCSAVIETVFLARDRESQDKDWLNQWRKPLDTLVEQKKVTKAADYLAVIKAIANGLQAAIGSGQPSPQPPPAPVQPEVTITFWTQGDSCTWCKTWEREVMPQATATPGWKVVEQKTIGSAPQFDVRVGSKTQRLVGYQSFDALKSTVKKLSAN